MAEKRDEINYLPQRGVARGELFAKVIGCLKGTRQRVYLGLAFAAVFKVGLPSLLSRAAPRRRRARSPRAR